MRIMLVLLVALLSSGGCLLMSSRECATGGVCPAGMICSDDEYRVCALPTCGNHSLDPGEDCDGVIHAPRDGCPADCVFHSPLVPGGTFERGFDRGGDQAFRQHQPATISSFRLDKHEVTVRRFRKFVDAGMGTQQHPPPSLAGARAYIFGSGWNRRWNAELPVNTAALRAELQAGPFHTWTDEPGANEYRPINWVTWYEAMAFCVWDGGFLPTATEWVYAASGGNQQRAFPWSDPPESLIIDAAHASYGDAGSGEQPPDRTSCFGDGRPDCAVTDLTEVGTKPAGNGRWGHSDLAGNVTEWTLDSYSPEPPESCHDCANLTPGAYRLSGGGTLFEAPLRQRAQFLHVLVSPAATGVRCARRAEDAL